MSEEAQQARAMVVAALKHKTAAQDRVYRSRVIPVPDEKLPAIKVYTERLLETAKGIGTGESYNGELRLVVEVIGKPNVADDADDLVDGIAHAVKTTLLKDPAFIRLLPGTITEIETQFGLTDNGNSVKGVAIMTFNLKFTTEYEPTIADDFETVQLNIDAIDPADPNEHAADETWPEGYGGQPGPDKRIEVAATITLEQDP